ncbi:hypothetical protein NEFER03_0199 [Nematocida sp. LUAm3]|nr:hypothetical protein NEFER03_0199 [Nematocida sp. LUAm3]KAI5173652.1 hypothetical protein NEFER02_0168 [Nematocida sp. LUAm2]KAI5176873.1 hypothetical protein NEFER01_0198 [Nematocida sp. LUAm1]
MRALKRIVLLLEGFKQERANYLYGLFCSLFSHLKIIVYHINLEGMGLSLIHSQGTDGISEAQYREVFLHVLSLLTAENEHFLFVCDSLTEPYERREECFQGEYSIGVNSLFVLEIGEIPNLRESLGIPSEDNLFLLDILDRFSKITVEIKPEYFSGDLSQIHSIKERVLSMKKKYSERVSVLLAHLKKRAMQYQRMSISQNIYLYSKYSTLYVLNSGYTLFYVEETPILQLVSKMLSKTTVKKKWSIYLCAFSRSYGSEGKKETGRALWKEDLFKEALGVFCEKEKISKVMHPGNELGRETVSRVKGSTTIEANSLSFSPENRTRDVIETLILLEGVDKMLVVASVPVLKVILCHLKKKKIQDTFTQSIPFHALIKVSIKGTEVTEKKEYITNRNT